MRKSIISTLALGTLASVMLLNAAGPADAKRLTCVQKAQACESRCARAYSDYLPCIYRTCAKQYGTCGRG